MSEQLNPGVIPTTVLHNLADGACRTIDQLDEVLELNRRQISDGAAKLIYRGFLERIETGCYQLTKAGLKAAESGEEITSGPWKPDVAKSRKPRPNTFRQRAWNAMRMAEIFTYSELIVAAAGKDDKNPLSNIQRYVRKLIQAGYVSPLPTRKGGTRITSNGFKQFLLRPNNGPIAPVVRQIRPVPEKGQPVWEIFDGNNQEVTPCL